MSMLSLGFPLSPISRCTLISMAQSQWARSPAEVTPASRNARVRNLSMNEAGMP